MTNRFRKIAIASLAAATLATSVAATSTPAAAWGYHPHHFGWGAGGVAAGLFGALAVGAIVANSGDGDCYITRQPVTDYYGNVVGSRRVRVCE